MRLAEQAAAHERDLFVGRAHELALLDGLLAPDSPHLVGLVSGPAGIGKSALLRALEHEARRADYDVVRLPAQDVPASPRPLLVLADGEDPTWVRDDVLPRLGADARVVIAHRDPPDAGWWGSAWGAALLLVPLAPLPRADAVDLLAARGVCDPVGAGRLADWAEGHPLSLALAAAAHHTRGGAMSDREIADLEEEVLDRLTDGCLRDAGLLTADRRVLAVAGLAPALDAALVDAVLPGTDGAAAERLVRGLPFARRHGTRVTVPPRIRRLLVADLRRTEPDLERALRLGIIDHLTATAQQGRPHLLLDIREVLDTPQDRSLTPYRALDCPWEVDRVRPGDATALDRELPGEPGYRAWIRRWIDEAPEHVLVVRRPPPSADAVAVAVGLGPDTVPPAFADDPAITAWVAWLRERDPRGAALLTPVTEVFAGGLAAAEREQVAALLLAALAQRSPEPNFRWWLTPGRPHSPDPAHCGGVTDPGLDLPFDSAPVPGFAIDYGPAGVIAAMRDQARQAWAPPAPGPDADDVRAALREHHDPVSGPTSPLARELPDVVEQAFGEGRESRLLRDVLVLGYLAPDASHARAMRALHLSRTTYFRRLREAVAALATWLAERDDWEALSAGRRAGPTGR